MKMRTLYILVSMMTTLLTAGKVECPKVAVVLEGTHPGMMGSTYHEHLEMHKESGGAGYNGTWKVDLFRQIVTYTHSMRMSLQTNERVDFKNGMWMQCRATVSGNQVISNCTSGNLTLDVHNNKIGSLKTNIWIGKIQGKNVSLKFHKENPWEPTITGTIKEVAKGELDLSITAPTQKKFVFSDANPGILEIELKAKATPQEYEEDIVWDIPDIGESEKIIDPPSAKGSHVTVRYKGLPKLNMDFGEKEITAKLDIGLCQASDTTKVSIFFPRDAKNNPTSNTPNWFYYWSQTSAKKGPAKYGDPANQCQSSGSRADNSLGYYRNKYLDSVYYICNLENLGEDFPFKTAQWQNNQLGNVPVTGIDTFAAACWHENGHYQHFKEWWFPHKAVHPFDPNEDFNKNSIKDAQESLLDKDKDLVLDSKEPAMGLNPQEKYTYPGPFDDEEIAAWFEEAKWSIGSANSEDWAKPGKQWPN